jgi:hypothetical protein
MGREGERELCTAEDGEGRGEVNVTLSPSNEHGGEGPCWQHGSRACGMPFTKGARQQGR